MRCALMSMRSNCALDCREMSKNDFLQNKRGQICHLRACRYVEKCRAASWLEELSVSIDRSQHVCPADLRSPHSYSTVAPETYQFWNPQQHPSRTAKAQARKLADCAGDIDHQYGASGKTSSNHRVPGAG